jgi:CBS domain-containing protein
MTANQLTQALSTVIDQISIRLLQLAEQQFGAPPVPYTWVVYGSQARREQTTLSDQDNGLLLDDNYNDQHLDYFSQLAAFVSDGLARCGFTYCPGNVMATNPSWRQPRKVWRDYFTKWINNPEPKALMHASIFFDMRALHGDLSLFSDLQRDVLQQCQNNTIFLAHMAANAMQYRPPLGFFRQFVLIHNGEHEHTFDIKRNGLIPVVDMVRVYALAAGLPAINTRERLLSGEASGALSHAGAEELLHAYEFIATLRARHQVHQYLDGLPMDNYLSPDKLDRHQRARLKDAFAAIRSMQQALEQRYQASRLA